MKVLRSVTLPQLVDSATNIFIGLGTLKKRITQRAQIQTGAAYKYWQARSSFYVFNLKRGFTRPIARCVVDVRRNEIDEVMRDPSTFCNRDLGSGNLNTLINLHRIAVNNLAAKSQSYFDSQRALAGSRRANDRENGTVRFECAHARENNTR